MHFVRSWGFWLWVAVLLPSIAVVVLWVGSSFFFSGTWQNLGAIGLGIVLILEVVCLCIEFVLVYLLSRAVKAIDIEEDITIHYSLGGTKTIRKIDRLLWWTVYTGEGIAEGLVIYENNKKTELNAPFLFKDHKRLFAALEKFAKLRITKKDGKPFDY